MSEQSPKKGKKKGKGRVVITNVRVTKETHERLKALTNELGVETMSDAIDFVVIEHYPQLEEKLKAAKERQKKVESKRNVSDN